MNKLIALLVILLASTCILYGQRTRTDNSNVMQPSDFGQGRSVGVSLIGPGLIGVPIRFVRGDNQLEVNISYAPRPEDIARTEDVNHGIAIMGGYNMFLGSKDKYWKSKFIKNYLSPKLGVSIDNINILNFGVAWHREAFRFHQPQYSRGFDLGLIYQRALGNEFWLNDGLREESRVNLYISFDWNWFK